MFAGFGILAAGIFAIWIAINSLGLSDQQLVISDHSSDANLNNDGVTSVLRNEMVKTQTPSIDVDLEVSELKEQGNDTSIEVDGDGDRESGRPIQQASASDDLNRSEFAGVSAGPVDAEVTESKVASRSSLPETQHAANSVNGANADLDFQNEPATPGFRMWRVSSGSVVSAKLIDHSPGQVLLERQDGSRLTANFGAMNAQDIEYLRRILFPDQVELAFHDAIERGTIEARTESYDQSRIEIIVSSAGKSVCPRIRISSGTWVELTEYPGIGRIYLSVGKNGSVLSMNSFDNDRFGSRDGMTAIPVKRKAKIPVIESYKENVKVVHVGHSAISKAGFDPLAAKVLRTPPSNTGLNGSVMSHAAGIWLMDDPNTSFGEFRERREKDLSGANDNQYETERRVGGTA